LFLPHAPASSAPARLSGGVGATGQAHDVALVQALLKGAKQANGQPYYAGAVDGRLGARTQAALALYRASQGAAAGPAQRPLATGDPLFTRLAQGQRLAVLPGTTTPYVPDYTGGPGSFRDELTPLPLNPAATAALKAVQSEIQRIYGIRLDVALPGKSFWEPMLITEPKPLDVIALAVFATRGLTVMGPQGQPLPIIGLQHFQAAAPDLAGRLAEIIEAMIAAKLNRGFFADPPGVAEARKAFRFPVESEVDGIERFWRRLVVKWREKGLDQAAEFLAYYLDGKGRADPNHPDEVLTREQALALDPIRNAYKDTIQYFNSFTLRFPRRPSQSNAFEEMTKITNDPTVPSVKFTDYWDADFVLSIKNLRLPLELASGEFDFFFASGQSKFRFEGEFNVTREGHTLLIEVEFTRVWQDRFDFGTVYWFDKHAQVLERYKGAKPFSWRARWPDSQNAKMRIVRDARGARELRRHFIKPLTPKL